MLLAKQCTPNGVPKNIAIVNAIVSIHAMKLLLIKNLHFHSPSISFCFRLEFYCVFVKKILSRKKKHFFFQKNFECLPNCIYLPIRVVSPQRRVRWTAGTC